MDASAIYYDANSQWLLSIVLASMILGVALDIHWRDFKAILKMPTAIFAGLVAQFIALPLFTTLITLVVDLDAGIELGMILVASCPGGAVSNFVTHLAKGNTALSISMTATSSALATFMLPINFVFWSQVNPTTHALMQSIEVSGGALFLNLLMVLALPLVLGLVVQAFWQKFASILHKILKITSILALFAFVSIAIYRNIDAFKAHFELMFLVVLFHNALAYLLGFSAGRLVRLNNRDTKATTIEVGMQNSSLAIAIVFTQFNAEAGMALISAFWGTWHLVSGLAVAYLFSRWPNGPDPVATSRAKESLL
ncbi:bile acid:sodium symporter family protein [Alteromonas sp. a30]|uniref:bile acid:sodium symporter family protein n=1 Tax=Alteromonas sp. a30 TaxID=2730917 RepID=UPI00227DAFE7|nr:bile acid:sodium symporter family protein [Alteromonas sp. a30]